MTTKKVVLTAVITVAVLFLLAVSCVAALSDAASSPSSSGVVSEVPVAGDVVQEPTESPVLAEAQASVARSGETVTEDGVSVLSEPLRLQKGVFGDDRYLCSMTTMENKSSQSVAYNFFYWSLKNPEGIESSASVFGSSTHLGSGDLVPGDKVKGDVCFPADNVASGEYMLSLEPFFTSGPEMKWVHPVG